MTKTLCQLYIPGKEFPDKFTSVHIDHDIKLEPEVRGVFALQYSFDGKLLAIGCGNGIIRVRIGQVIALVSKMAPPWGSLVLHRLI